MNPFRTFTQLAWAVALVLLMVVILLTLSYCSERSRLKTAKAQNTVANATGKALDGVAAQTPVIRQDQEEKQREVDAIEGSDARLPDGYGSQLERVRRGQRNGDDPR